MRIVAALAVAFHVRWLANTLMVLRDVGRVASDGARIACGADETTVVRTLAVLLVRRSQELQKKLISTEKRNRCKRYLRFS